MEKEGLRGLYRGVGAVGVVGRIGAMARVGAVEDVVMDERGQVDQFDDRGAADEVDGGADTRAGTEGEEWAEFHREEG